jgi:hypothetical protein
MEKQKNLINTYCIKCQHRAEGVGWREKMKRDGRKRERKF